MTRRGGSLESRLRDERGQTLVEYSMVILLVLIVLFGIIEVGRLMLAYTTLAQAARDGVRYAVTHGSDRYGSGTDGPSGPGLTSYVENIVTTEANAAGLTGMLIISVSYPNGNDAGDSVRVVANYTYTPIVGFIGLAPTISLSSTTQGTITY